MRSILILFLIIVFKTEAQTSVLTIADSLYQNGNYSKAIEHYKSYENQNEVHAKVAKAYVAIGNYDAALKHYELAIESNPDDALVTYSYGKLLYSTKKFKEASNIFNKLISIDAENPNYYYELGLIVEKNNDSLAKEKFNKAFKLDNSHQKAIFKIAKHHLVKRKHDSVDYYVDMGLKNYENNIQLISLKAQNYYWQQYYRKAGTWFKRLIELGETSEFIYEKLSLCYEKHYDYKNALQYRLKALKFSPNDATAIYVIGTYYLELKDYKKAEEYLKKALVLLDTPLDNEYGKLAAAYSFQKKYPEAIVALKKAIKETPKNQFLHFRLALVLEKYYEDYDAKIKAFEDIKTKFPDSRWNEIIDRRIKEIKEEQFKNQETNTD